MKRMQQLTALLLVCLMLLAGCGKRNAGPEGSGAAAEETTQSGRKADKSTKSDKDKPDEKDAEDQKSGESAASPSAAPGQNSGGKSTAPSANPIEDATDVTSGESGSWDDVLQAQEDLLDNLAVSPVGNWQDSAGQRATMVVDDEGRVTILWAQDAGTTYFWLFTVDVNEETGEMTYRDCVKQIQANNEPPKVLYQNGTGKLSMKDGNLYWQDDIENAGAQCVFVKTM